MKVFHVILLSMIFALLSVNAFARPIGNEERGIPSGMPRELEHVGVKEHLNASLPLDASFRDHTGQAVALRDLWDGKRPTMLVFAYHSCPVLCGMILSATLTGLKGVQWSVGKEFDVVVISIDPKETLEKTAKKREQLITEYVAAGKDMASAQRGFHFLVGDKTNIDRVANAAGFEYTYEEDTQQYGHSSVVMITKPTGELARYLYGLEFSPNDLRLGLFEAAKGRSVSTIEQIILYCYHYDPKGGKYVLLASRVMQVGGALTALVLGSFLALFWTRERKRGGLIAKAPEPIVASVTATQVTP